MAKANWVQTKAIPGTLIDGTNKLLVVEIDRGRWVEAYASQDGFWSVSLFPSREDFEAEKNSTDLGAGVEDSFAAAAHSVELILKSLN